MIHKLKHIFNVDVIVSIFFFVSLELIASSFLLSCLFLINNKCIKELIKIIRFFNQKRIRAAVFIFSDLLPDLISCFSFLTMRIFSTLKSMSSFITESSCVTSRRLLSLMQVLELCLFRRILAFYTHTLFTKVNAWRLLLLLR